jgi:hypothetical protein
MVVEFSCTRMLMTLMGERGLDILWGVDLLTKSSLDSSCKSVCFPLLLHSSRQQSIFAFRGCECLSSSPRELATNRTDEPTASVILYGDSFARLTPKQYTYIFIGCDLVSLSLQGVPIHLYLRTWRNSSPKTNLLIILRSWWWPCIGCWPKQ